MSIDIFSQRAMEHLAEELEADAATYASEADRVAARSPARIDNVLDAARMLARSEGLADAAKLLRVRAGLAPRPGATIHDLTQGG